MIPLFETIRLNSEPVRLLASVTTHLAGLTGPLVAATLWQGCALTALVALCLRHAPRATAALRFTVWTAALLFICLLPLGTTAPVPTFHAPLHVDARWSVALAVLWMVLSLFRAVDLLRHAVRLRALSRQARPIDPSHDLASLLSAHRNAQLCTSDRLERPGVIGFFHPRILIPTWLFHQLSVSELEQIVLHELEHLRRRDDWLNLLQKLVLVVFPLNPSLYWIDRRLCRERELACDEGVVRRTRAPRLYAACLARLAERGIDHRAFSLALGFLERQSELARRVAGVLRAPHTLSPRQSISLTGAMIAVLCGGAAELARCPQLVSFAAAPTAIATNSGAPHLAPETWMSTSRETQVLYTDAALPRLVRATLSKSHKPIRRTKIRRTQPPVAAQHASMEQPIAAELLANDVIQLAAPPAPVTPTLVRYTLVHVDGGWLLLQL